MPKYKYYTDTFPFSSSKCSRAPFFEAKLEMIVNVLEILHKHTDESYYQSPWQSLHNMVLNNEYLFGFGVPDIIPCANTPNNGQSNQIWSSPLKGESSSSYFTKMVSFVDGANEALVPKILETYSILYQKSVEFCEKANIPNDPVDDKMGIAPNEDSEAKINRKDKNKASLEFEEGIKDMFIRNLVQIRSGSIIKQAKSIEVEVDIDLSCMPDESFPKNPEQESNPSKKFTNPGKPEKIISPTGFPSKRSTNRPIAIVRPFATDRPVSRLSVDTSDPNTLNFLTERLLSMFSCRKSFVKEIEKYFQKCEQDACNFKEVMTNLTSVAANLPKTNEPYLTVVLLRLRSGLSKKASEIADIAKSWSKEIYEVTRILRKCDQEISSFDKEYTRPLSEKEGASKLSNSYLMIIESHLKDFCAKANEMMIIINNRRTILLNSLREFELFVNHFVKYLIIMGILKQ